MRTRAPHCRAADTDTQRRCDDLAKRGFHFVGCGVSGGEEGALKGPSLMPGGDAAAWPAVEQAS